MPSKKTPNREAPSLSRLMQLVEDIDYAMLTTMGSNGLLVSRPLSTRQSTVEDLSIRFFTDRKSAKVEEIKRDDRVNLAYASASKNVFVSFAGRARVHRDPAILDALWSDAMKAFFPKGKSDPDLVILEVAGETAEVWEGPSSLIGKAIAFVTARITGNADALGSSSLLNLQAGRKTHSPRRARSATTPKRVEKVASAKSPTADASRAVRATPARPGISAGVAGVELKKEPAAAESGSKASSRTGSGRRKGSGARPAAADSARVGATPLRRSRP